MEKKFTLLTKTIALTAFTFMLLFANSFLSTSIAQVACSNSLSLYTEDFGTGTVSTSNSDVGGSLTFQFKEPLVLDGFYRISNKSFQNYGWNKSSDHTGNVNGQMLVANGQSGAFYTHTITRSAGFLPGDFSASSYAMNVDLPGTCASPLLPTLSYTLEYLDASSNWVPLSGSPSIAPALPVTATPTWVAQGALFTLPATGSFLVTSLRLTISDETGSGCGNDFALDDINISQCPEGGVTPVTFLRLNARQRGSGVSIDFSTSQELNSDHFEVEKSVDGNTRWAAISTLKGEGNSSIVKNYNAYDAKPFSGINFYRIKQVDRDGRFKYSSTVTVKISTLKTGVSVLANPFSNTLTVDFLSGKEEIVNARLVDITGKQVANEKWTISIGSTRKDFTNVSGLQKGMYVLSISNASGEILYNNKVLKQ